MITSLYTIVLLIGIVCFLLFFKDRIRCMILLNRLHGPPKKYILGNLTDLITGRVNLFNKLRYWGKTYGPVYNASASIFYASANICGPEEFEKIATKNIDKGPAYLLVDRWLGKGLLTSTGSLWHTRRKILTPAFHFNILQQFLSIFNSETRRLVDVLQEECEKPWTNVMPHISLFTLYSITETSMGTALDMNTADDKLYITSIQTLGTFIFRRLVRPWTYGCLYYYFSLSGIKERRLLNIIHSFTNKIIAQKAAQFKKFKVPQEDYNYSSRKKLAFLDLLLNAKLDNDIDDEGIKDEVNTFMFEGYDTTSMSICFTLMLLANYSEYQNEIHEEIMTVVGDKDPDMNDLNNLKIMERFIKESLRLYPSVPFISRILEEDTIVNGYLLPKKSVINIHIYDILRNEKYWPDPENFDPDRFLAENCTNRHPYAYVPFSAGPRNCIGQRFAILEIKSVLCGILRNFVLQPVDTRETIKLATDIILRPEDNNIKVKFRRRHEM